jgi:hypothetical protein
VVVSLVHTSLGSSYLIAHDDLEVLDIYVAQLTDLLVDVTLRHDFISAGRDGLIQGQLSHPDNPDHIFESASANKIRDYSDTYHSNSQVPFLLECMSTLGRIHGEFLRLLFFFSNKQADDYLEALVYQQHKQEEVRKKSRVLPPHQCLLPANP